MVATKVFTKGDILCEYAGDLLSHEEAIEQERIYEQDPTIGCYLYYTSNTSPENCGKLYIHIMATTIHSRGVLYQSFRK